MTHPQRRTPIDPRDLIEREPANWRMLPIIAAVVVVIFFIAIPWLLLRTGLNEPTTVPSF